MKLATRALALALGALGLSGCPLERIRIDTPPTYSPGHPLRLVARARLRELLLLPVTERKTLSGRVHLAVRLPAGWRADGDYQLGGRRRALYRADLLEALYGRERETEAARWRAFVTFLETDVAPDAEITLRLSLTPPKDAGPRAELAFTLGVAPGYPQWRSLPKDLRTLTLEREPLGPSTPRAP